jgi:hypothetical protein
MFKIILSIVLFLGFSNISFSNIYDFESPFSPQPYTGSDSLVVKVNGDQNAFMCPFLTPMFLEKLRQNHAVGVHKKEDLSIHFTIQKSDFSEDLIYKLAENVGYMRSLIHIEHHDK